MGRERADLADSTDTSCYRRVNGKKICRGSIAVIHTGCSLNIVFFFEDFKIYSGLWCLSAPPRCHCVYTMTGQTPANTEFRKITTF